MLYKKLLNSVRKKIAKKSLDSIQLYLNKIGYTPLLSAEEEIYFGRLAKNGDKAAKNRFIKSNLRLVVRIAKNYIRRGLPFLDLIEEGNLGLIHAVDKFNPELGYRFSTYATYWIKQSVERAIMNQVRVVRLPVHIEKELRSINRSFAVLLKKLGRNPSYEELAEYVGLPVFEIQRIIQASQRVCSIDAPLNADSSKNLLDIVPDKRRDNPAKKLSGADLNKKIIEWMQQLEPRCKEILEMRFGLGKYEDKVTFDKISISIGLSRERVRQIQKEALMKLKKIVEKNGLTMDMLFNVE